MAAFPLVDPRRRRRAHVLAVLVSLVFAGGVAHSMANAASYPSPASPTIVPTPQAVTNLGSPVVLGSSVRVVVDAATDASAQQELLDELAGLGVTATLASPASPGVSPRILLGPGTRGDIAAAFSGAGLTVPANAEGYAIRVIGGDVVIGGSDVDGQFYGVKTFRQLTSGTGASASVANLSIRDWPLIGVRGTIEGFYGRPWSATARLEQMSFYGDVKMNTYVYSPKDDSYLRSNWRQLYPATDLATLQTLVSKAKANHVRFTFAVSPGTSVCYSSTGDRNALIAKFQQLYDLGVRSFSVPLDDISMSSFNCSGDSVYGSPGGSGTAKAQASFLNDINTRFVKAKGDVRPLQMVPTEYAVQTSSSYKTTLGATLASDVLIGWTGTEATPPDITTAHISTVNGYFGRKVYIWDNYPCNDYTVTTGRLLMGAYQTRDVGLSSLVTGIVSNPMNQAAASKPALVGVAAFAWNDYGYDKTAAWNWGMRLIAHANETVASDLAVFGDLNFMWPYASGPVVAQSPTLRTLAAAFNAAPAASDLTALTAYADSMLAGSTRIRQQLADPTFISDADPWLTSESYWGQSLTQALAAVRASRVGDTATVSSASSAAVTARNQAKAVTITNKQNRWSETAQPMPYLGDGVLSELIDSMLTKAAAGLSASPSPTPTSSTTTTPPATGTNVALGSKSVTASSTESGTTFTPAKAVDGRTTTRWASNYTDNQWLRVKLTAPAKVTTVTVRWEAACAASYTFMTSVDGVTWTSYPRTSPVCGVDTFVVNGTTAVNYVKIQGVKRATGWGYSIWELEVWGLTG